jgi:hypothetical protein
MKKQDEMNDPKSCWNKAKGDELLFVLLERDMDAPETIRFWVNKRIARRKNKLEDPQMQEALALADQMDHRQKWEGVIADQ